jgi:hypothetical protein
LINVLAETGARNSVNGRCLRVIILNYYLVVLIIIIAHWGEFTKAGTIKENFNNGILEDFLPVDRHA